MMLEAATLPEGAGGFDTVNTLSFEAMPTTEPTALPYAAVVCALEAAHVSSASEPSKTGIALRGAGAGWAPSCGHETLNHLFFGLDRSPVQEESP